MPISNPSPDQINKYLPRVFHFSWREILLLAVTVAVYLNTFGNGFVWDDVLVIENNPAIKTWQTPLALLTADILPGPEQATYYRPLQLLSYGLDYQMWGLDPFGFHLMNLILHVLCALLFYRFARTMMGGQAGQTGQTATTPALIAALLWAVHPVHTEAVTYIAGRSDSLAGVFFLSSLLCFIRARKSRSMLWLGLSLSTFFLALMAREAAFLWVFLLVYVDYVLHQQGAQARQKTVHWWSASWRWYLPYVGVMIAYGALRIVAVGISSIEVATTQVSLLLRVLTMLKVTVAYIAFLLVPLNPHMERLVEPATSIFDPYVLGAGLLVGLLVALAIACRHRAWPVTFGIVWFAVALIPVSNIVPLATFMAEHWLYLPSMGLFLALGWGLHRLMRDWRQPVVTGLVIMLAIYGGLTVKRNQDWRNARAIFESTVAAAPHSARAWGNLGNAYLREGETKLARMALEKALELNGAGSFAARHDYLRLGILARKEGDPKTALQHFQAALALNPGYAEAFGEIALTHMQLGQMEATQQAFKQAIALNPEVATIHNNYGNYFFRQGALEQALSEYYEAIRLNPDYADAYNNVGSVQFRLGHMKQSEDAYLRALQLNPYLDQARQNLAIMRRVMQG